MLTKAIPILREQKFREFISETVLHFVSVIFSNLEALQTTGDVEALHDMRVATRRLRESLRLFEGFYLPARLKKLTSKIRKVTRALGLPREMDVNVGLLQSRQADGGLVLQSTHEHLLFWCDSEQARKKRQMLARLEKIDMVTLESDLRSFAQSVLPSRGRTHQLFEEHQAAELETYRRQIPSLLLAKAKPVLDFRVTDKALKDDEKLHRVRIATKKLRYALEILKPLQPGEVGDPPVQQCRELQDILGNLHDRVALIDFLKEHQSQLSDQGLLLLTHGCARIANESSEAKQTLLPQIKPAHDTLVVALLDYFRSLEPTATTPAVSQSASNSQ
jgi:CHAD domain-containing protein